MHIFIKTPTELDIQAWTGQQKPGVFGVTGLYFLPHTQQVIVLDSEQGLFSMLARSPSARKQQVAKHTEEHGYAGKPKSPDLF